MAQEIEKVFQKKTDLEHVLLRPEMYVGSMQKELEYHWLCANDMLHQKFTLKKIDFIPGLLKIFDEILVNAADNKQRDPNMTKLKVSINEHSISVYNDGQSIPIVIHKEYNIYVAELIFGFLRTSSSYNDDEKRTVGGTFGFGSKLTNILSLKFVVETQDGSHSFKQIFTNNMSHKTDPIIKDCNKPSCTKITFFPDFKRFGIEHFDEDTINLFKRRVYDVAGSVNSFSNSSLKVYLNDERIPIKNFKQYVNLFSDTPNLYCKVNNCWEIIVCPSDNQFRQTSFVNAICTTKGGRHVNVIVDQICKALMEFISKKDKTLVVKTQHIKNHLWVFVNCLIVNPAFDGQTKDALTTKASDFGSDYTLPPSFLKQITKSAIVEQIMEYAKFKGTKDLKKTDGKKQGRLFLPKLDDANDAGQKLGHCVR